MPSHWFWGICLSQIPQTLDIRSSHRVLRNVGSSGLWECNVSAFTIKARSWKKTVDLLDMMNESLKKNEVNKFSIARRSVRRICRYGIDYLSPLQCLKVDLSSSSLPLFSWRRKAVAAWELCHPQVYIQHHLEIMWVQSWLTAWMLYCILILVLSNFSKVEKLDEW